MDKSYFLIWYRAALAWRNVLSGTGKNVLIFRLLNRNGHILFPDLGHWFRAALAWRDVLFGTEKNVLICRLLNRNGCILFLIWATGIVPPCHGVMSYLAQIWRRVHFPGFCFFDTYEKERPSASFGYALPWHGVLPCRARRRVY
jgi:hypothetical protein